jgi:predicted phosphodiesterase
MGWRRFLPLLITGFVLSIGIACGQLVSNKTTTAPEAVAPVVERPTAQPQTPIASAPTPLPPETEAIAVSAAPPGLVNPPRGDVRLVVISDINGPYGSTDYDPEVDRMIKLLPFWQPDLVVCSGDMIAGQNLTLSQEQLRAMWGAFDQRVAAPLRQAHIPYGFTLGNHDASSAMGGGGAYLFQQERDIAAEYWRESDHDPGVKFIDRYEFPFYFTFEYNGIFFLSWDGSSHHIPPEKLAWVEKALASPAAQQAKMRILLGHLPLYGITVGRDEPAEVMENADQLRTMLEKYNVHTYISGHQHGYYPAHQGNIQLLHTGILGSGPRPLINTDLPPWKALTIVDVNFDAPELTTYTTYDMQTLKVREYQQLPRFLTGHNGMVLRRDVKWEELTASEKTMCEQRLDKKRCAAS